MKLDYEKPNKSLLAPAHPSKVTIVSRIDLDHPQVAGDIHMRTSTIGESARDIVNSVSAALKRFWMMYRNGGYEDEWAYSRISHEVIDINTKMPITGPVMRKAIDGRWIYRQQTEEERGDFDADRAW